MDARMNPPSNAELDEEQAPGLQSHQFATAQAGDQGAVDTAHGRHPVSQEPRGVHAEEAGGCYPEHEGNSTKY
jgi:hypothetical protein